MDKKTRTTVWLKVNGEQNTLRGHFVKHGYLPGRPGSVAKRWKMKQSEVPIEGWREYLGEDCHFCEMPDDWQLIVYGNNRGAQKNREIGLSINYPSRHPEQIQLHAKALKFLLAKPVATCNAPIPTYY